MCAQEGAAAESLVTVPESNKSLPRTGVTSADLLGDLDWTKIFDEQLVLTREHCEIGRLPGGKESTVKAPGKLFPDAQHKCASCSLRCLPVSAAVRWLQA